MSVRTLVGSIRSLGLASLTILIVTAAPVAFAVPTPTAFVDTPTCDSLSGAPINDELGHLSVFPVGEKIDATATYNVSSFACLPTKIFGVADAIVRMVNLNSVSFTDVWYVAEPATTFTNVDGTINGEIAFKIDTVGINTPLLNESITANGIFEPGEFWTFVVQDYMNGSGLAASDFLEIGVPSFGPASSASIVAAPVPEPGTFVLVAIGLTGLAASRRSRRDA
jgi:PEP-CTERM motif